MYRPFEEMPDRARIWIYQSDKPLADGHLDTVNQILEQHCHQWAAHGRDLTASYTIKHSRFVILAVDEEQSLPTGCSIDSSVHAIQELGQKLDIDFFKRTDIIFTDGDGTLTTIDLSQLPKATIEGTIQPISQVFNNLITTKRELTNKWQQPAQETWLSRYFN